MGAAAGLHHRAGESASAPTVRIAGRGESGSALSTSPHLRLSDAERSTLAEIGKRLGRKYLAEVACIAKPATTGMVSPPDCPEVRWLQATLLSRAATPGSCRRRAHCPHGAEGTPVGGYDRIVGALPTSVTRYHPRL